MRPTREPTEAKSLELPPTRRLPRVKRPMPDRWETIAHRTYRHTGPLRVTLRVTDDVHVAPFCVVPSGDGYAFELDTAVAVTSDIKELLSWVKGQDVEARHR